MDARLEMLKLTLYTVWLIGSVAAIAWPFLVQARWQARPNHLATAGWLLFGVAGLVSFAMFGKWGGPLFYDNPTSLNDWEDPSTYGWIAIFMGGSFILSVFGGLHELTRQKMIARVFPLLSRELRESMGESRFAEMLKPAGRSLRKRFTVLREALSEEHYTLVERCALLGVDIDSEASVEISNAIRRGEMAPSVSV